MSRATRSLSPVVFIAALLILAPAAARSGRASAEGPSALPLAAVDLPPGETTSAVVVLAGGCFWGVQGVYQHVKGVTNAVSGYAGGSEADANYESSSEGRSGHAAS